jgi:hypothetical protein
MRLLVGHFVLAIQLQLLCEIFWLQDHSEDTWTRQKQGMVRGWLGICGVQGRDCRIQKLQWYWLGSDHSGVFSLITWLGPSVSGWLEGGSGPGALSPILCPGEATSSQLTALLGNSICKFLSADWDGWGASWVLMEFVPGQGAPVQCPHQSLVGPGFLLSSSGGREAWAKLYALSLQCSSSQCC